MTFSLSCQEEPLATGVASTPALVLRRATPVPDLVDPALKRVQMTLSRVIDKMVVDEGRALQPCRYRLFTHMSCIILYPYSTQPCRGYTHVITNTGGNNY